MSPHKIFKYISRVFLALVLTVFLYGLCDLVSSGDRFGWTFISETFRKLFTGESWSNLWYLYMLIGLYLMLPFYRLLTEKGRENLVRYYIFLNIVFFALLPLFQLMKIKVGFYIPILNIYPCYLFMGYALDAGVLKKQNAKTYLAGVVVTTLLIAIMTRVYVKTGNKMLPMLWRYSSLAVILQSGFLFGYVDNSIGNKPEKIGKILLFVDKYSFDIYLLHMIFVRYALKHMKINPFQYGFLGLLGLVVSVTVISLLISMALEYVRKRCERYHSFK